MIGTLTPVPTGALHGTVIAYSAGQYAEFVADSLAARWPPMSKADIHAADRGISPEKRGLQLSKVSDRKVRRMVRFFRVELLE